MSGFELEALVLHALRLADALYHPNPSGMNIPKALSIPFHQTRAVTWAKLIESQLLIGRESELSCSLVCPGAVARQRKCETADRVLPSRACVPWCIDSARQQRSICP